MNPLDYTARGWSIFPCHTIASGQCTCGSTSCKSPGKHPRTHNGVKDASADPSVIKRWQEMFTTVNWALACGEPSGVFAIDVDPRHAGDSSFEQWEMENGVSPDTLTNLTGGGGFHLIFKMPADGLGMGNRTNILPGVDVRGTGGYIMLPPSRHESGSVYAWRHEDAPLTDAPPDLMRLARSPSTSTTGDGADLRNTERIPEGMRNEALYKKACSLRRLLHDDRLAVEASVHAYNAFLCDPPLDAEELRTIIDSAFKQDHSDDLPPEFFIGVDEDDDRRSLTDLGNANRLVDHYGAELRYVEGWGWVHWDGSSWNRGAELIVEDRCKTLSVIIRAEAEHADIEEQAPIRRWAHQSESAGKIAAVPTLARSDSNIKLKVMDFDSEGYYFNCANGTIDLRTGDLLPFDPRSYCTRKSRVEYDPTFVSPEWEKFIYDSCDGDTELMSYLQRAAGYSMTGEISAESLFLITGPQASGKSTFVSGLQTALGIGEYAMGFPTEMIMVAPQFNRQAILAQATGIRMASVVELPEGKRMDEAFVKSMTGGDIMQARELYGKTFQFKPQFKLWVATNHDPIIRDQAIWRRIKKIPFERTVPVEQRNPKLKAMIENPSIGGKAVLNWMVKGCLAWQAADEKLMEPTRVLEEVASFQEEQDRLGAFISEYIIMDATATTPVNDVYRAYMMWCNETNERPIILQSFVTRMRERPGIDRAKDGRTTVLKGVRVRALLGVVPPIAGTGGGGIFG